MEFSSKGLAFKFYTPQPAADPKATTPMLPIVVLHGLLGSHKNFASFAKTFSQAGHPVLCLDCRNHGASFHSTQFDYPAMATDLEQLFAELESQQYAGLSWRKVVLLGHSMGGRIIMMHALLYPARPCGLVIVDVLPSVQNSDIGIGQIVAAMRATGRWLAEQNQSFKTVGRKDAEAHLRGELQARNKYTEPILQFLLLCNLQKPCANSQAGYLWACNIAAIEKNLEQIVCWPAQWLEWQLEQRGYSPTHLPLLLVAGGRSPYVQGPDSQVGWELLQQYFPHSAASPSVKKVIENAHHWPHTEKPQKFCQLVFDFLRTYRQT